MVVDDLAHYLFDGQAHPLQQPMLFWLTDSRQFVSFVTVFRDKIRKKLRVTQDSESIQDLRLELETAFIFLKERKLSVVYEPEPPGSARAPDFAVSYTTRLTVMVEVTRIRAERRSTHAPINEPAGLIVPPKRLVGERVADTVCSKLGQLQQKRSNILIVGVEMLADAQQEVWDMLHGIQQRAERNELAFFQRYKYRDRADFFRHYQRLSAVLVRPTLPEANWGIVTWENPQATVPIPAQVRTVFWRSHVDVRTG